MLKGADVSDWQGDIDWQQVAGAGISFAVIKATEGLGGRQDYFTANRSGAHAAGPTVGLYHFARPESGQPIAQADHFLDTVGEIAADEFVVLDVETGDHGTWADFITRWCGRVHDRTGLAPLVYMSESPAKSMPSDVGIWPLWVAGYPSNADNPPWPTEWEDWQVGPWQPVAWQWTSNGRLPGISGRVDLDIAPDDFYARIGLGTPPGKDDMTQDEANTLQWCHDMLKKLTAGFGDDDYDAAQRLNEYVKEAHASAGTGGDAGRPTGWITSGSVMTIKGTIVSEPGPGQP